MRHTLTEGAPMTKRWMLLLMSAGLISLAACEKKSEDSSTEESTEATAEETSEESTDSTETTEAATEEKTEEKTEETTGAAKSGDDAAMAHLSEDVAKGLFPEKLGDYKLDSFKIVEKDDKWHEIKTNYKGKSGTLKVIINDYPPKGNPEWEKLIAPAKKETQGFMSMMHAKGDKHTLMVIVEKRYRVDFKSEDLKPEEIEKIAEKFDLKKVKKAHKNK